MMCAMSLVQLAALTGGELCGPDAQFGGVTTDSRSVGGGDLFVAIPGQRFDGHDYIAQAAAAGAVGALVQRRAPADLPLVVVSDSVRAMGALARAQRDLFTGLVAAITGSCGKTTVKHMLQGILSQEGLTVASQANFNNEIGLPLTVFRFSAELDFAVLEMGATRAGDIARLCDIAAPDVAGVVNVMPAHLQGFGSVSGVAQAKGEIYDQLGAGHTALINADEPWEPAWRERALPARIVTFGLSEHADVRAVDVVGGGVQGSRFTLLTPQGEVPVVLPLPGAHNVANAVSAAGFALACGGSLASVARGLGELHPVPGRLSVHRAGNGVTLIDDSYNASPGAVKAAIDLLARCDSPRILILGAMRELGEHAEALHRDIGLYARRAGLEKFWGVGGELRTAVSAFGEGGRLLRDTAEAVELCREPLERGCTALVKGSRSVGMEAVYTALVDSNGPAEGDPCS